ADGGTLRTAVLHAHAGAVDLDDAQAFLDLGEPSSQRLRVALAALARVLRLLDRRGEPHDLAASERELVALSERALLQGGERAACGFGLTGDGRALALRSGHDLVGPAGDRLALRAASLERRSELGLERALAVPRFAQLRERVVVALAELGRPLHADRDRLLG